MITVVMGPPGAGKSTLVASERKPGDVVVDFDALAQALGSTMPHDRPESVRQVAWAARSAAIGRIFDGIDSDAWIIQTNLDAAGVERWGRLGARFVVVDPGRETVEEQARADGRDSDTFKVIEEWYANPPVIPGEYVKGAPGVRTKAFNIDVKAVDADLLQAGEFIGYAAVFDNVDSYGDVIRKGAFTETLAGFGDDGAGIPCYWGHRMDDPMMNIGQTISAVEDDHGLKVHVALDLETEQGRQVHRLIKTGRVRQMSFAYDINEASAVEVDGYAAYELRKLTLHEVSVVPIGANQQTELLAVKTGADIEPAPGKGGGSDSSDEEPAEEPEAEEPEVVNAAANAVKSVCNRAIINNALNGFEHRITQGE